MKFTIEVEMKERWIPQFLGMLEAMEHLGDIGASRKVSIYSDGDGDFRPKFKWDKDLDMLNYDYDYDIDNLHFDAG